MDTRQPSTVRAQQRLAQAVEAAIGLRGIRMEFWDGGSAGPVAADAKCTIRFLSQHALDKLLGALPERAFGRAYAEGLIDIEPLDEFLRAFAVAPRGDLAKVVPKLVAAEIALGGRPDRRQSAGEARLTGHRHSARRDRDAINHHYDLPEEFYALWLDNTLTYSCAYFRNPGDDLDTAQRAKLELVCRKLRLEKGERVLDVGCGWGSFPIYAAQHYGVDVVGITLSETQAVSARRRVHELGLDDQVEIRLQDYRQVTDTPFDAVATIGMVEHVGRNQMNEYAQSLVRSTRLGGRLLLHGITTADAIHWHRGSFLDAFVFPDAELTDVSWRDAVMVHAGLELRDVESLRGHYALTLHQWISRLEKNWDRAISIVGEERARIWRMYMTGSMVAFEQGTISVFQSLFVRPTTNFSPPLTRSDWYN